MKDPKRYYCGNGEGMFEDDKNGHLVEYSEHKSIVDALTKELCLGAVRGLLPFTDVLELNVCIEKLNTKQITLEEFVSDVWNTAYRVGYDMASGNNR